MKKPLLITTISILVFCLAGHSQSLSDADSYTIDQIYKKVELDYGTLGPDGQPIECVFVEADIKDGTYEIDITDGPGELYEIKDTDYYISFNGYFGYAGYSTKCILKKSGNGYNSSIVYKLE